MARCSGYLDSGKECTRPTRRGSAFCVGCEKRNAAKQGEDAPDRRGFARTSYLPDVARERARRLLNQDDTHDLTAEIAAIQTILTRYYAALDEGEPVDQWRLFKEHFGAMNANFKYALEPDKFPSQYTAYHLAFQACKEIARRAAENRNVEKEIVRLAEKLAKIQATQSQIDEKMGRYVPADKLEALFNALLTGVYESIPDDLAGLEPRTIRAHLARIVRAGFAKPEFQATPESRRMIRHISERHDMNGGPIIEISAKRPRGKIAQALKAANGAMEAAFDLIPAAPFAMDDIEDFIDHAINETIGAAETELAPENPAPQSQAGPAAATASVPPQVSNVWNKP